MTRLLRVLRNPAPGDIDPDFIGFLRALGGPTVFEIDGHDRTRTRALCTLLHGNEPSGARALHRWLLGGAHPAVNLVCVLGAADTALHEEPFRHRFMPGERDLNRCFGAPFDDRPGRLAGEILAILAERRPECLIDVHNTSGLSPPFGVCTGDSAAQRSLVALFCRHLVVTDLRLGALMETSSVACPAVTVECGGARDPQSDRVAEAGLLRYFHDSEVRECAADAPHLEIYRHPVRLELAPGTRIAWGDAAQPGVDLTVRRDLVGLNFRVAGTGTTLGWPGAGARERLRVRDGRGRDVFDYYFRVSGGVLHPARELKLFMVTENPIIACSDCLLYAAASADHDPVRAGAAQ